MEAEQFFLFLAVCAMVSHLVPAVSGFPLGPVCGASSCGISFSSQMNFPGVSLHEGVRRIHTLEHLENITVPPGYFEIQRVSQPHRYGSHVTACAHCRVGDAPQTVYVMGRPDAPQSCTIMCVQDGTQRAVISLRASPLPYEDAAKGHRLTVICTYFRGARVYDRGMEPVLRFLRFFGRRGGGCGGEHANLQWYRRMVLGLGGSESALD